MRVGFETGGIADGAADVFGATAGTADEVMMVVAELSVFGRSGMRLLKEPFEIEAG